MKSIMEEKNETIKLLEPFGHVPEPTEIFSEVPQASADFRTVPNLTEEFSKVPQAAERRETHTLTVKETARMFETAGVARTERSVINWCQLNRQGIARLDSYYDPNERKYYITPQSVEAVIQEEIQRAKKQSEPLTSEAFGNDVKTVKHPRTDSQMNVTEEENFRELKREILDLKITNRGKDYLIEQLKGERIGVLEKLLSTTRKMGELEAKMSQLESPK
jgi:hypothetical protein